MGKPTKILVVDDEPSLVDLCRIILEGAGFVVRGAMSGKQALEMVREEVPDLILLDVMMPGMDGIEVCRRIRKKFASRLPYILMYTADDRESTRMESLDAGADDLLTKDTPVFDLPTKIEMCFAG